MKLASLLVAAMSASLAVWVAAAQDAAPASQAVIPPAKTYSLFYEASVSGIGVADVQITATLEGGRYSINALGNTYGAASLFGDLDLNATAAGTVEGETVAPVAFGTDNQYNGDERHTRVAWKSSEAIAQDVIPSLADEERTPIPDDARQGALDPISAFLAFATSGPSRQICEGAAKIFDGRRSYTLTLAPDAEGIAVEIVEVGDVEVQALKCRINSYRTGGKSPDGILSSSGDSEDASIWFWRDPEGYAIPVRVEAEAPIGHSVAQLAALPSP